MRSATIFALALAFGAPGLAYAAPALCLPKNREGALQAETIWVEALRRRDVRTLDQLLAKDFVDTSWQGASRSKATVLDGVRAGRTMPSELSGMTVQLSGDTAIVRGLNTVRRPDGAVLAKVRFTDVFAYRTGSWQAVAAQETVEK
jgi:ketosteroid isomerase-like protein